MNPQGGGVDISSFSGNKDWCPKEMFIKYSDVKKTRDLPSTYEPTLTKFVYFNQNPPGGGGNIPCFQGKKAWGQKETFVKYSQGKRFDPMALPQEKSIHRETVSPHRLG